MHADCWLAPHSLLGPLSHTRQAHPLRVALPPV